MTRAMKEDALHSGAKHKSCYEVQSARGCAKTELLDRTLSPYPTELVR